MKHLLLFISLLFIGITLQAQLSVYDISNYKARYERRPSFYVQPQIGYGGNISNTNTATNRFSMFLPISWKFSQNTDKKITFWNLDTEMIARFGQRESTFSNADRFRLYESELWVYREVIHYYQPDKFWGWLGGLSSKADYDSRDDGTGQLSISPGLSIFHGHGRIERAEDALLATWIIEDLKESETIDQYQPEDIEALARTITDIIGNRTFDLRRRRIYELKQLQQTLFDRGLVDQESFDLFAILNDNWAFANRAVLRHGKRLEYGLGAETSYFNNESASSSSLNRRFNVTNESYIRYSNHKIVHNNGSRGWSIGGSVRHLYSEIASFNVAGISKSRRWNTDLYARYNYTWIPTSRTSFSISNSLSWRHIFPINELEKESDFFTTDQLNLSSFLSGDFFLSYRWSIRASALVFGNYRLRRGKNQINLSPSFSLTSYVYLF